MKAEHRQKLRADLGRLAWGENVEISREFLKRAVGSQALKVNCWRALVGCLPYGVAPDEVVSVDAKDSIFLFYRANAARLSQRT
jgi:hypothetical protein